MDRRPYLLHCLSPLHAGTGQAVDVIDLPIARMKATGIPFVPGSSVKGVLRDARAKTLPKEEHRAVFGFDTREDPSAHGGALLVHDARLLCLPVRSFKGTFAWVTSPLLLHLAHRDLMGLPGLPSPLDGSLLRDKVVVPAGQGVEASLCVHTSNKVYLEDLDFDVDTNAKLTTPAVAWARALSPLVWPDQRAMFERRFVVADDETMTFLWETATQVDTRVRLSSTTRTVEDGALWTEESLPPETLLLGLLTADESRRKDTPMKPAEVLSHALDGEVSLQFGGKATVGRGRCRVVPVTTQGATP